MTTIPPNPKIYHITHIDNLSGIASSEGLVSDAKGTSNGQDCSVVGMSSIKQRRLQEIEVTCHPDTMVG